jgi:hypothetical protein
MNDIKSWPLASGFMPNLRRSGILIINGLSMKGGLNGI